jgi:Zn-dependent M28 family amino/carboxypeptidase
MISRRLLLLCLGLLTCVACSKPNSETQTAKANAAAPATAAAAPAPTPVSAAAPPTTTGPAPKVNSTRAFQYVKEFVSIGSRPPGSPGHAKAEQYILSKLKGDTVEVDSFTAKTPVGEFPIHNIIAKFPGKKDGIIVIAGHYETNYPLPKEFVGANDGGSTTGLLLELANQFRGKQLDGYSVWLVWTDGEEAFVKWTATDSLYGTKHLAQRWQKDGTAAKVKAFVLLDMIGDADLDVQRDNNSTPWLSDLVYQAAATLGYQSHFFQQTTAIEDDHMPFAKIGIPVVDIIDIDYGYANAYHHTTQDTMDKLSPKSLQIIGDVVLQMIQYINQR